MVIEYKRIKIADLDLNEKEKLMLTLMAGPLKEVYEIAARCKMSPSWVRNNLFKWIHLGYVKKTVTPQKKTLWMLNEGEYEL